MDLSGSGMSMWVHRSNKCTSMLLADVDDEEVCILGVGGEGKICGLTDQLCYEPNTAL